MKLLFPKIFISFVVAVYVMSTIGVCIFSHYCGGELEQVTLFTKTSTCCDGEEESQSDNDCCKDESVHLTFQKDFTFYTVASDLKAPVNQLFIVPAFINDLSIPQSEFNNFIAIKIHPPNLVQHEIVSSSVIRI